MQSRNMANRDSEAPSFEDIKVDWQDWAFHGLRCIIPVRNLTPIGGMSDIVFVE